MKKSEKKGIIAILTYVMATIITLVSAVSIVSHCIECVKSRHLLDFDDKNEKAISSKRGEGEQARGKGRQREESRRKIRNPEKKT